MSDLANLSARFSRRPLLLTPSAAEDIIHRLRLQDPREMRTHSRLDAILRKVGLGRPAPVAMEDDDHYVPPPTKPAAYSPLWVQQAYGEPEAEGFAWSLYRGIAMMDVSNALTDRGEVFCGTFYHGYDTIKAGIADALDDVRVKGVFIRMDTPGGVVAGGLADLHAYILKNNARAGGKPIWFYCDMAASAGYWVNSAGDRRIAPSVGLVGSIGAVIIHQDWSEAYEKAGIKVESIQFGAGKTDGAHWKALTAQARADLQAEIDHIGHSFVTAVCAGIPNLTPEAVLATEARVFMAENQDEDRSGLALGLVDDVQPEAEAFEELIEHVSASASPSRQSSGQIAAETPQEKPMVTKPQSTAKPAAKAAEPDKDDEADKAPSETEDPEDDPDKDKAAETDAEEDDTAKADNQAEATRISGSPEAKAHPQMALAAINSGMTFAQFKAAASVAAEGAKAIKSSPLRDAMAGVKRVGADTPEAKNQTAGSVLVANARARAGK